MQWYYADAGRQVGPIEETALDDLVRTGVVRDDTLIWREGMENWQPHGSVRGVRPPPPAPPVPMVAGGSFCSECGRPFSREQLSMVGNAQVCEQCKPIYLQRVGGQAVGARRYAGFWIRFVARLIDGVLLGVAGWIIRMPLLLMFGVGVPFRGRGGDFGAALPMIIGFGGIVVLLQLILQAAYEIYFVSTKGATIGKQVLGLKIIRAGGSGVPAGLAAGRYFAQFISAMILFIGYIMAGFDPEKRALHDRICETRVIYVK